MRGTIITKGILTARGSCPKATEYSKMLGEVPSVLESVNDIISQYGKDDACLLRTVRYGTVRSRRCLLGVAVSYGT